MHTKHPLTNNQRTNTKQQIPNQTKKVELAPGAGDEEYLERLDAALDEAARRFPAPHIVIYNAGTDVLRGDPLGRLGVTADGIIERCVCLHMFVSVCVCARPANSSSQQLQPLPCLKQINKATRACGGLRWSGSTRPS